MFKPAQKCGYRLGYFNANYTLKLSIDLKFAYFCCYSFGTNFLQKCFKTLFGNFRLLKIPYVALQLARFDAHRRTHYE